MRGRFQQLWPVAKTLLAVAIVGGVGWQFARLLDNPELWKRELEPRPAWLAMCAALYVAGFGFSAGFWYHLLRVLGAKPMISAVVRAYYIGHLGKYVPGKAWALVLRATLLQGCGVRAGTAALTATYETLTTMASGALVAVLLFTLHALDESERWKALVLLTVAGVPILPGVFNRIVDRLTALARRAARKQEANTEAAGLPPIGYRTLALGLALTACGWALFGLSLGTMIHAVLPSPPAWSLDAWGRYTAFIALAYVAGFLTLPAPGGLGVRELILQKLLETEFTPLMTAEQAAPLAAAIALILRLLWTLTEVAMAVGVYFLPSEQSGIRGQEAEIPDSCP
ncbi:MAG: flippase-like domain-containing protein [Gemmataceae bacterium]|nr:flippase-like domain-containing protein [Gemmataceae bacterium]